MSFTIIFAAEPGGRWADQDVGHCWVAVECPKGHWTVRGFYPDANAPMAGVLGGGGLLKDDFTRFAREMHHLRTRTQRGLAEPQVRTALNYMFRFGASARLGKSILNHHTGMMEKTAAPDMQATHWWSAYGYQCAWFAVETCQAAGFLPIPYNTKRLPWKCHEALGRAGEIDAHNLPTPFGPGPR